jgi:hypothetical protein
MQSSSTHNLFVLRRSPTPMNVHAHAEYLPPKTWQQFEELCADTFAADWSDPALVRHGRAGQRQHGVDIVTRRGCCFSHYLAHVTLHSNRGLWFGRKG